MDRNKIFKLIETIVEEKSFMSGQLKPEHKIPNLAPIESVYQGYSSPSAVAFTPDKDYKKVKEYRVEVDLNDDKIRLKELTKLNNQITKYNKWVEEKNVLHEEEVRSLNLKPNILHNLGEYNFKHKQYWALGQFDIWSFMAFRTLPKQSTYDDIKDRLFHINDEELYKANRDDTYFLIRINKTIAEYIHGEIREAIDKSINPEKSIWYEPNIRFGNWISQYPSDAKPYSFKSKSEDDIEREKRNLKIFNYIEDGLKKNRQRKNLISEMATENNLSYPTVRDIYYEMDKSNELQTEIN